MTQITAAHAGLDRVVLGLLDDHARHCFIGSSKRDQEQRVGNTSAVARLVWCG